MDWADVLESSSSSVVLGSLARDKSKYPEAGPRVMLPIVPIDDSGWTIKNAVRPPDQPTVGANEGLRKAVHRTRLFQDGFKAALTVPWSLISLTAQESLPSLERTWSKRNKLAVTW